MPSGGAWQCLALAWTTKHIALCSTSRCRCLPLRPRVAMSHCRSLGTDWVGAHMAQQHMVNGDSTVVVAVQLTDPVSGATRVLVRGAAKGSRARLVTDLKQQARLLVT